eukprot:TRINITY_DN14898_c0_g2_i1.p1 TRINITY_DN14898_c0_g2~~TRINITY_DN14898_c0_g2_i1.p1  ORF type:complete len:217 (-),score=32.07 TRINITY_DN14898_c0_g2_i1:54-611(-)
MAWDSTFDHTWAQRIEKEERAVIDGYAKSHSSRRSRGSRSRGSRSYASESELSCSSRASRTLSSAGESALSRSASSPACSISVASSSRHGGRSRGARSRAGPSSSLPEIPETLQAITKFPVDVKDLITGRVDHDEDGKEPKISMKREQIRALWWPGRGCYTKWKPEFRFTEAEWSPDEILKPKRH